MDLPAFLLSKNLFFRVHRNAPVSPLTAALSCLTAPRSRQINWLGTCLVGLIRSRCAISPSSSVSSALAEILLRALVALRLASEIPCGTSSGPPLATKSLPQNKKPGVERRVQPPTLGWLHAMLDFFLARVRKEPHLGSLLTFESDCDAPVKPRGSTEPPGPFVTIPAFFYSSSPGNNYFVPFSSALWTLCKNA